MAQDLHPTPLHPILPQEQTHPQLLGMQPEPMQETQQAMQKQALKPEPMQETQQPMQEQALKLVTQQALQLRVSPLAQPLTADHHLLTQPPTADHHLLALALVLFYHHNTSLDVVLETHVDTLAAY